MFTVSQSTHTSSLWLVLDWNGEERGRWAVLENALNFAGRLIYEHAEASVWAVYVACEPISNGVVTVPAWANVSPDYWGPDAFALACEAAADISDLYAGHAVCTVVETTPELWWCDVCRGTGRPLSQQPDWEPDTDRFCIVCGISLPEGGWQIQEWPWSLRCDCCHLNDK